VSERVSKRSVVHRLMRIIGRRSRSSSGLLRETRRFHHVLEETRNSFETMAHELLLERDQDIQRRDALKWVTAFSVAGLLGTSQLMLARTSPESSSLPAAVISFCISVLSGVIYTTRIALHFGDVSIRFRRNVARQIGLLRQLQSVSERLLRTPERGPDEQDDLLAALDNGREASASLKREVESWPITTRWIYRWEWLLSGACIVGFMYGIFSVVMFAFLRY